MGGNGVRLGMPFPKPLVPTITNDGIVPVYRHTLRHVRTVASIVYALVRPHTCECLIDSVEEDGVKILVTAEENLAAAFGDAGYMIAKKHGEETLVVCALPDSVWRLDPNRTLQNVIDAVRGDGALAIFESDASQLDRVVMSMEGNRVLKVETKASGAEGKVHGWGAFVIRARALATLTAAEKDGPQLGRLDMGWAYLGQSIDLGTQDRYINHHDLRRWT